MKKKYLFGVWRFHLIVVAAWYDWWVGGYYDSMHSRLYLMIPFVGLLIQYVPPVGGGIGKDR